MNGVLAALLVATLTLSHRQVRCDDCLSNDDDTATLYIQQMKDAINDAVCELVNNTHYGDYLPTDGEEFDFIVVGAGSAGAVVANRLSENPSWRVLLLEAGGDPTLATEIPYFSWMARNSPIDWNYSSEPEPTNCLGSPNGKCPVPRGKLLGGSSSTSGMGYVRGHPEDYNMWEKMGNPGWGFKDMLSYFKKSEDLRSEIVLNETNVLKYHGVGGLVKVESLQYDMPLEEIISAGSIQLGYHRNYDLNSQFGDGFYPLQATLENTRRCSTAKAFLLDFQNRRNLKISKNAYVEEILINEQNEAYGVSFLKNKKKVQVKASKEIILSAGAINTPQLLMLSGVGPQDHLEELGITVKQNLKVGYNFQDHPVFPGFLVSVDIVNPVKDQMKGLFDFLVEKKGYLTSRTVLGHNNMITTSQATYRNIQVCYQQYENANNSSNPVRYFGTPGFQDDIQNSIQSIIAKKLTLVPGPVILRPRSRGRITLNSTNPQIPPKIYPGYLNNDEDMVEFLEAIAFLNKLVQTQSFIDVGAQVERIDIPACREFEFQTEEYWRCSIKHLVLPYHHAAGSCKMGPREEPDSVVDPELRVIGVDKLRVVDASIMPTLPSGSTNAPTIAIGEKGADMIKQSWTKTL